jgi:hypothetical protein
MLRCYRADDLDEGFPMKRVVLPLILAAATLLGLSALAPSGIVSAYPPGQNPTIRVNVSSVRSSEPFTVTISPCVPGETVLFRFRNQTVTTTCDPTTVSASATFIPRVNPGRGPQGFASPSRTTQSLVSQAAADVPAPGPYEVCGDLTGSGATVPPGITRPQTLCSTVEVLAESTATTPPPAVTAPGGGLATTGSSGLGTTTTTAIVLIAAGALLLIVTQVRRRRSTGPAST